MTFLVAYDGSALSKSALLRADEYSHGVDIELHAITVVPADGDLARERGWLDTDQSFSRQAIDAAVRSEVQSYVGDATVHVVFVEKHAPRGRISRAIRTTGGNIGVEVLFVGSETAGHLVTSLASVGQSVAFGEYDLHVVRRPHPTLA